MPTHGGSSVTSAQLTLYAKGGPREWTHKKAALFVLLNHIRLALKAENGNNEGQQLQGSQALALLERALDEGLIGEGRPSPSTRILDEE